MIIGSKYNSNPDILKNLIFALSTDPVNSAHWFKLNNFLTVGDTIHPLIGLMPEVLLARLLGPETIWISVLIGKGLCAAVSYYYLKLLSESSSTEFKSIVLALLISLIYLSLPFIYGDRLSRPHLVPTFALIAIVLIYLPNRSFISTVVSAFLLCIPLSHDPWLAPYVILFILMKCVLLDKNIKAAFIFCIALLISIFIAYFRIIYQLPVDDVYLEYLGKKIITDRISYSLDYVRYVVFSPYVAFLSIVIFTLGVSGGKTKVVYTYCITLMLGCLPALILGIVVQPYHYREAAVTFGFLVLLVLLMTARISFKLSANEYVKNISQLVIIPAMIFVMIIYSGTELFSNKIVKRADTLLGEYSEYVSDLKLRHDSNSKCPLWSNDLYIRQYAHSLGITVYPKEGVLSTRNDRVYVLKEEIAEVAQFLAERRKFAPSTMDAYPDEKFLHDLLEIRTHDKYSVSRSWIADSVAVAKLYSSREMIDILRVPTFKAWPIKIPKIIERDVIEKSYEYGQVLNNDRNIFLRLPDGRVVLDMICK